MEVQVLGTHRPVHRQVEQGAQDTCTQAMCRHVLVSRVLSQVVMGSFETHIVRENTENIVLQIPHLRFRNGCPVAASDTEMVIMNKWSHIGDQTKLLQMYTYILTNSVEVVKK